MTYQHKTCKTPVMSSLRAIGGSGWSGGQAQATVYYCPKCRKVVQWPDLEGEEQQAP